MLEAGMSIPEDKASLTLLRSKQQSHYLRGWMKHQSHFLLASVIKENLVAWIFMFCFFPSFKKNTLNGMKGQKILKIKIISEFPTNYIVFCFQKSKPKPVFHFPSASNVLREQKVMLNILPFTNNEKNCSNITLLLL